MECAYGLLVRQKESEPNKVVAAIEWQSRRYGTLLNKGSCIYIRMNVKHSIKFANGETVKNVEEAAYVGALIAQKKRTREK